MVLDTAPNAVFILLPRGQSGVRRATDRIIVRSEKGKPASMPWKTGHGPFGGGQDLEKKVP